MSTRKLLGIMLAALLLVTTLPGMSLIKHALAQSGGGYDLSWSTVDGGGGAVSGGGYTLNGTAGQPDSEAALSGGSHSLYGGFWPGVTSGSGGNTSVYLPIILKTY